VCALACELHLLLPGNLDSAAGSFHLQISPAATDCTRQTNTGHQGSSVCTAIRMATSTSTSIQCVYVQVLYKPNAWVEFTLSRHWKPSHQQRALEVFFAR